MVQDNDKNNNKNVTSRKKTELKGRPKRKKNKSAKGESPDSMDITINTSSGFEDLNSFWNKTHTPTGNTPKGVPRMNGSEDGKQKQKQQQQQKKKNQREKQQTKETVDVNHRPIHKPSFTERNDDDEGNDIEEGHSRMSSFLTKMAKSRMHQQKKNKQIKKRNNTDESNNNMTTPSVPTIPLFSPNDISPVSTAPPSSMKKTLPSPAEFDNDNDDEDEDEDMDVDGEEIVEAEENVNDLLNSTLQTQQDDYLMTQPEQEQEEQEEEVQEFSHAQKMKTPRKNGNKKSSPELERIMTNSERSNNSNKSNNSSRSSSSSSKKKNKKSSTTPTTTSPTQNEDFTMQDNNFTFDADNTFTNYDDNDGDEEEQAEEQAASHFSRRRETPASVATTPPQQEDDEEEDDQEPEPEPEPESGSEPGSVSEESPSNNHQAPNKTPTQTSLFLKWRNSEKNNAQQEQEEENPAFNSPDFNNDNNDYYNDDDDKEGSGFQLSRPDDSDDDDEEEEESDSQQQKNSRKSKANNNNNKDYGLNALDSESEEESEDDDTLDDASGSIHPIQTGPTQTTTQTNSQRSSNDEDQYSYHGADLADPSPSPQQTKKSTNKKRKKTTTKAPNKVTPFPSKGIPQERSFKALPIDSTGVHYDSDDNPEGLRRSRRVKLKPLKFWKGERFEYIANNDVVSSSSEEEEENSSDDDSDNSTQMRNKRKKKKMKKENFMGDMPVVGNIIKALPTPYKKRKVSKFKRKTTSAATNTKKKKKSSDDDEEYTEGDGNTTDNTTNTTNAASKAVKPFDSSKLRKKLNILDGDMSEIWDEPTGQIIESQTISRSENLAEASLPIVHTRQANESNVVGLASQAFNIPSEISASNSQVSMPGWICGNLKLPPKGIKDAENVGFCAQVFCVLECQPNSLEVAYADPNENTQQEEEEEDNEEQQQQIEFIPKKAQRFLLSRGDMFQVPPNNVYRIENHSREVESKVFWTIIRPQSLT